MMQLGSKETISRRIIAEACTHEPARDAIFRDVILPGRLVLSPHYLALRRTITQLGGFLLLNRGPRFRHRTEVANALEGVAMEWRAATDGLKSYDPPRQLMTAHAACLAAAELIGSAIELMRKSFAPRGGGIATADEALPLLQRAQRVLLAASDDRTGMTMVSFDCACCAAVRN